MKHDPLADVFCSIKNMEAIGKKECVTPASKLIRSVLKIMEKHGYIGGFELVNDGKGGRFRVKLTGKINNCNVIRPRFSVKKREFIKWEKRFLPAEKIGILIITTPNGVTDQEDAKKQGTGGRLMGFVY